jgi:Tfp pilus assembly pilus retraction ATPase PilT
MPPYLEKSARLKQGLIIISGVYDSGKSTSLAAVLNTLNELGPARYINTLESPVEHLFANNKCIIEQREIGRDVASYSHGLGLALEGDIDMVGLDKLTGARPAKKMLEVLEAGRSVILTIDASSVTNALNKIFSFLEGTDGVWARQTLAQHLLCALGQKLVSKIGGGRVLVYEFLVNSGMVSSFIAADHLERIENLLKNAKEFDMVSLEKGMAQLVQEGKVKLEEALMEANDKEYLKSLLR